MPNELGKALEDIFNNPLHNGSPNGTSVDVKIDRGLKGSPVNTEKPAEHRVEVRKSSQRKLNLPKLEAQIDKIVKKLNSDNRSKLGWRAAISNVEKAWYDGKFLERWKIPDNVDDEYLYNVVFDIRCAPKKDRDRKVVATEFSHIVKGIDKAGQAFSWSVSLVDGKPPTLATEGLRDSTVDYCTVDIPPDWPEYFNHLFDRESQINIVLSALKAGIKSQWASRFHVALIGDPASGKTEILRSLKKMLGEEAVMEYDATATTGAGAIRDLQEREILPRILIVEEIEKTREEDLRWMLGLMDQRAEIRKNNYRTNIHKETKLLTLATVNDFVLFKKMMYGALSSRFSHHVWCPRPSRQVLERILRREVDRVMGRREWIQPTLDYAIKYDIFDPRTLIAICLCGQDKLLDGSYQADLEHCANPETLASQLSRMEEEKNK